MGLFDLFKKRKKEFVRDRQMGVLFCWVELNDMGTIDFGYRSHKDPELDDVFQKIVEMAWKLGCYTEAEGGDLLYDPAEDK